MYSNDMTVKRKSIKKNRTISTKKNKIYISTNRSCQI